MAVYQENSDLDREYRQAEASDWRIAGVAQPSARTTERPRLMLYSEVGSLPTRTQLEREGSEAFFVCELDALAD